jgi:hypothetical protein
VTLQSTYTTETCQILKTLQVFFYQAIFFLTLDYGTGLIFDHSIKGEMQINKE